MEKFVPIFTKLMIPILDKKKYVDDSLARSKILALPAPEQVLPQIGGEIPSAQLLAIKQDAEAFLGIPIPE